MKRYTTDEKYMKKALHQADRARAKGEVPIGAVIVYKGKVIGRGFNERNTKKSTLKHAELTAIAQASRVMGDWRLEDCDIYVTLEPCQMCAGAIVQARMKRVVVGCMSPKSGSAGSIINILQNDAFNHQAEMVTGVLETECSSMLTEFFKDLRVRNREEKERLKAEQYEKSMQ